jgi:hypothetical protein
VKSGFVLILLGLGILPAQASESVVARMIEGYRAQGAVGPSAVHGRKMWSEKHVQRKSGREVSCATCHTAELTRAGAHVRTGKRIDPMAPSVNPDRLSDPAKIRKWLRRNCKWTIGRECTPQEKADFLAFIQSR